MWLNWIYKKSVIPPPLSIVYVLLPGFWVMKHLFKACCPVATLVSIEIYLTVCRFSTRSTFWVEERLQIELSKSHTHVLTFFKSLSTKPIGLVNRKKLQDLDTPQSPSHWMGKIAILSQDDWRQMSINAGVPTCIYLCPLFKPPNRQGYFAERRRTLSLVIRVRKPSESGSI